ncbi:hypothetical protein PUN28_020139 [Cardiocondyla obscurior]|uniref:Uncharacterized protein n=1 Tax=Cardiocondyla obscurior TaxID=286306 RepID=A0AAW2EAH0_9HYME
MLIYHINVYMCINNFTVDKSKHIDNLYTDHKSFVKSVTLELSYTKCIGTCIR